VCQALEAKEKLVSYTVPVRLPVKPREIVESEHWAYLGRFRIPSASAD
jgi:hypothetical protein